MKVILKFTRLIAVLVVVAAIPLYTMAAINQILYTANYSGTPVLGTDTLDGITYSTVSYGDLFNIGTPGMPSLPVEYIRFSVPYNATNFIVTSSCPAFQSTNYNLGHLLYPIQQQRLMNDTTPDMFTPPDSSAYYPGSSYPSQVAWFVDEGFLDGENHIVTVAVMPLGYTHTSNSDKVTLRKLVNVKLKFELSDSLAMYPIVRNDSTMREEGYSFVRSMVVNPGQVKTFAPSETSIYMDPLLLNPNGISGNGLNGYNIVGDSIPHLPSDSLQQNNVGIGTGELLMDAKYLIVTTADLFHSMRRLAALKRQKGYTVGVVTMDQVLNDSIASLGDRVRQADGTYTIANGDDAGKLRQFLRNCYIKCGTKYVLLAGNIPYKRIPHKYNDPECTFDLISDMYFCDLNADWDTTGIDYRPELFVGRILCDNGGQIDNYTDKLLRYELNPGGGDVSYLGNAFFSEGRDFRGCLSNTKIELESVYPDPIIINDNESNNSRHPRGKEIIDTLNESRVGFACIFNHGDSTRITVYGKDSIGYQYYIEAYAPMTIGKGLNCLTNKKYPMIFYAPSCVTMPFDYTGGLSFGKSFTIGKDYGGPVFIGYTRSAYPWPIELIVSEFAKKIRAGYYQLGVADAISRQAARFLSLSETLSHGYLGDPSLELWTGEPRSFINITIERTNSSVIVSGFDSESTIVSYRTNSGTYRRLTTGTLGVTFNNVSPNGAVMVYKHNYLPYIAPLIIQNENLNFSQYVIARDFIAGNSVDNTRTPGDVVIKSGIEYEIEASGTVTLDDGFSVEKGATFAVYPSSF